VEHDGYRVQLHKSGGRVTLFSRNGIDFSDRYPSIIAAASTLPTRTVIIDGELSPLLQPASVISGSFTLARPAPMNSTSGHSISCTSAATTYAISR
jgi:ATP-dependent DNA ligase